MSTLSRVGFAAALVTGFAAFATLAVTAQVKSNDNKIDIVDNCLPGDPGWDATGGCQLNEKQGDVPNAEFGALLRSPLTIPPNGYLIGHPSWRNEPSHITTPSGKAVKITNRGGRVHTFTEVANFGGGRIGGLNIGLTAAPECNPEETTDLAPGASTTFAIAAPGLHKFQCCIHPWMRATVRVQ
jgi:plastocyanin